MRGADGLKLCCMRAGSLVLCRKLDERCSGELGQHELKRDGGACLLQSVIGAIDEAFRNT